MSLQMDPRALRDAEKLARQGEERLAELQKQIDFEEYGGSPRPPRQPREIRTRHNRPRNDRYQRRSSRGGA